MYIAPDLRVLFWFYFFLSFEPILIQGSIASEVFMSINNFMQKQPVILFLSISMLDYQKWNDLKIDKPSHVNKNHLQVTESVLICQSWCAEMFAVLF